MKNRDIAAVLFNISAILTAQNGNPFRIQAYRRAARNLLRAREQIAERIAAGKPLGLPRLGKSLSAKISELAQTNRLDFYEQLCEELPPAQRNLLRLSVPGIGPTLAARLQRDLGATDPANLRRAAASGRLQRVWGIGPKRTAAILNAIGARPLARQELLDL